MHFHFLTITVFNIHIFIIFKWVTLFAVRYIVTGQNRHLIHFLRYRFTFFLGSLVITFFSHAMSCLRPSCVKKGTPPLLCTALRSCSSSDAEIMANSAATSKQCSHLLPIQSDIKPILSLITSISFKLESELLM